MKKIISVLLSVALSISVCSTVFATEATNISNDDEAFVSVWTSLRDSGNLFVDENGYLSVTTNNVFTDMQGYDMVLTAVDNCNIGIASGYLAVDATTGEIKSIYSAEELLENTTEILPINSGEWDLQNLNDGIMPLNTSHGCSVEYLNLITMCRTNYTTLSDYYDTMLKVALVNPYANPYASTVGFWVGKVMEGGDWDYKVQPGFAPYNKQFCAYFDNKWNHITSEYIGNFNYGYTGSLLFTLNVLHIGSSAVAGSVEKDQADWPAIDAGYAYATA